MKGQEANYVIPLRKAFYFPPDKRVTKVIATMKNFVKKHTRRTKVYVSNEVNEFVHLKSKNVPRRISATILLEGERATVFLEKGKQLEQYKKKSEEKKKKEKKEKASKEEAKKEETKEEDKKKLEDKRAKEEAAKASEIKRKTAK